MEPSEPRSARPGPRIEICTDLTMASSSKSIPKSVLITHIARTGYATFCSSKWSHGASMMPVNAKPARSAACVPTVFAFAV